MSALRELKIFQPEKFETELYDGIQKPTREGVFKRKWIHGGFGNVFYFSYWNMRARKPFWGVLAGNPESAVRGAHVASCSQDLPWCGLTEEPL